MKKLLWVAIGLTKILLGLNPNGNQGVAPPGITTNRIKIELGKGVTTTKTCNTSYFSKQKNKIFFVIGDYTDEMIGAFCDRVMKWSRSNDETQTYRTMWEKALNKL